MVLSSCSKFLITWRLDTQGDRNRSNGTPSYTCTDPTSLATLGTSSKWECVGATMCRYCVAVLLQQSWYIPVRGAQGRHRDAAHLTSESSLYTVTVLPFLRCCVEVRPQRSSLKLSCLFVSAISSCPPTYIVKSE